MRKQLKILGLLGFCCATLGFVTACGGDDSTSNTPPVEKFVVDLVQDGDWEVLSDVSTETSAGLYQGTEVVLPTSITVTYGDDGETVTVTDHMFRLEKLGKYTVTYVFDLPDGSTETYVKELISKDTTAPTIVNKFKRKYKEGDVINVNESTLIVDAFSDADNVDVDVKIYQGEIDESNLCQLTDGNMIANTVGEHIAVVTATDGQNNVQRKECTFTVVEKEELEYFNEEELFSNLVSSAGGPVLTFNKNPDYVKEGEGSLRYTSSGTWTAFILNESKSLDWGDGTWTALSFWVYNAHTEYAYTFGISGAPDSVTGISSIKGSGVSYTVQPQTWQKIIVDSEVLAALQEQGYDRVAISVGVGSNGGNGASEQWKEIDLYFDYFRAETGDIVPPTIIAPSDFDGLYLEGDTVTIPTFTATDNETQNVAVEVKVYKNGVEITPLNNQFIIDDNEYKLVVTATDGDGNVTEKEYPLIVYVDKGEYYDGASDLETIVNTSGTTVEYNADKAYIRNGNGSVKVSVTGTTEVVKFLHEDMDWATLTGITLWLYNPTAHNLNVGIGGFKNDSTNTSQFTNSGALVRQTLAVGQWTKVSLSAAQMQTAMNDAPYFGVMIEKSANSYASGEWSDVCFYVDGMNFKYEENSTWANVTTSGMYAGVVEVKTGESTTALGTAITAREQYGYAKALFTDTSTINWTDKKLTFKVYNPTNVGRIMRLVTYADTSFNGNTLIQYVHLAAGETQEITLYGDEMTAGKYLGIYVEVNDNNSCHWSKLWADGAFVFYDFALTAGTSADRVTPTTDDYKWALGTATSNATAYVNTDSRFVYTDGETYTSDNNLYSMAFVTRQGNWPSITMNETATIDWANVSTFSFKLYNPSATDYSFKVTIGSASKTVTLTAQEWTTVTFTADELSAVATGTLLTLSGNVGSNATYHNPTNATTGAAYGNNIPTDSWATFKMNGVYVDCFEVTYKA